MTGARGRDVQPGLTAEDIGRDLPESATGTEMSVSSKPTQKRN